MTTNKDCKDKNVKATTLQLKKTSKLGKSVRRIPQKSITGFFNSERLGK